MQKNYFLVLICCLLAGIPSFPQSMGNLQQRNVAMTFMQYVQDGKRDKAAQLLDPAKVSYDDALKASMKSAAEGINDVADMTIPAVMPLESDSMVCFRCRFYAPKDKFPDYYQVDIQFADATSLKICKLVFYDRATLVKMQKGVL
jgi:hypothetical protein